MTEVNKIKSIVNLILNSEMNPSKVWVEKEFLKEIFHKRSLFGYSEMWVYIRDNQETFNLYGITIDSDVVYYLDKTIVVKSY